MHIFFLHCFSHCVNPDVHLGVLIICKTGLKKCKKCVYNCIGIHRIHTVNPIYFSIFTRYPYKCLSDCVRLFFNSEEKSDSRTAKIEHLYTVVGLKEGNHVNFFCGSELE